MTNKNGAGETLSSFAYTYAADGNILTEVDHTGATTTYTYDLLGRLICENGKYYDYDVAGNRMAIIVDNVAIISYTYNSDGELIRERSTDGMTSDTTLYEYDANGNLTSKSGTAGGDYAYDVWNQMTSADNATYTYNAQGLRVEKTVGNDTDSFILVGGNVWADSDTAYFRGIELISNGSQLYLYNVRGDVIQLLNYDGTVAKEYDYDAYGNELQRNSNDSNPFRYCGEYYDTETGFIYLRARYYDPMVGRFTSVDPVKDGLNWYAYCNGNPVTFVDSNGLWIETIWDVLSLGASIVEVAATPTSIGSWIGLAGDVIDVFIPGGGIGEAVDAVRASSKSLKILTNTSETATDVLKTLGRGFAKVDDVASEAAEQISKHIQKYVSKITEGVGEAFKSFREFKKAAGKTAGFEWHHIVEQCQSKLSRAGFDSDLIQNAMNMISLPKDVHKKISKFYSSIPDQELVNTGGKVFRNWLNDKSFEEQFEYGMWVIAMMLGS